MLFCDERDFDEEDLIDDLAKQIAVLQKTMGFLTVVKFRAAATVQNYERT